MPALIFIQEEPPSPPSVVANDTKQAMSFAYGLKQLIHNKNYILLFLTFNFLYGIHSSLGATISTLAAHYNYGVTANSTSCFVYLAGGIFNSFFLGTILDKY